MLHLTTVDEETYILLQNLFSLDQVKSNFALAGGTSLALQIGHRKSIDLDLFSPQEFNVKELEIILVSNKSFRFEYRGNNTRMLFADINSVKCDFEHEPAKLIMPFYLEDKVKYFSIQDIGAMKLHTICGRGKKKDFFDIYCLLQMISWEELLQLFIQKYDEYQAIFLWRSIQYFEDADQDPDILGLKPFNERWSTIKKYIQSHCK